MNVMKYRNADYVRSFIYALACEGHNDEIGCSLVQRPGLPEHWEVHLYSKDGMWDTQNYLLLLAIAICQLVPCLTFHKDQCDIGTIKEEKKVDSICIW